MYCFVFTHCYNYQIYSAYVQVGIVERFPILIPNKTYIIAEIGVNHNGDLKTAKALVDVAKRAGADAVKFQTFNASKLVSKTARKAAYQLENDPVQESQYEMLKKLELSESDLLDIAKYTHEAGLEFLSTPFDRASAELLDRLDVSAFKVSSGDLTALSFLEFLAGFGRPMIISTGMATLAETADAVDAIKAAGDPPLAILHCVSQYPAAASDANLRAIDTMATAFNVPVGWSDHTIGLEIAVAAVARGARIVEKHYTLDKTMSGPDHKASLEPDELAAYINAIRMVDSALGDGIKRPCEAELDTIAAARRSLVCANPVKAGEKLSSDDIIIQRPGTGIVPKNKAIMVGRTAKHDMSEGHVISWNDVI
jgi:N-acetylneuraminate synthase